MYGVDHGVCFNVEDKLRTVLWGWRGEPLDEPAVAALYKAAFVLIRPDQHVAWRGAALGDAFEAAARRAMGHANVGIDSALEPVCPAPA